MPSGHSRRKARAAFDPGPDDAAAARERRRMSWLDEPYSATTGRRAGRDVHESESLLTSDFGEERRSIALARSVLAAQIDGGAFAGDAISWRSRGSFPEPNSQTA